ncbi:MAG: YggS family pyridoxal phosphate-dependent enzyme [Gammaproteobacteria bacterium]|nr:YggS family pyridoxal phosphate-dependent enzyme [Gammaproteobacteria bacterium]
MNAPSTLDSRLATVNRQIRAACERFDRDPGTVNLLAVSKTKPAAMIRAALEAGQRDFGENYLQEALGKIEGLRQDATWHFIGPIQSNKTRAIAENFSWVHTLASAKHGRRLNDARPHGAPRLKVLVQVNISDEASKAGIKPAETRDLIETLLGFERLEVRGLMAIPRIEATFDAQSAHFRRLAELRDILRGEFRSDLPDFGDLSMGMSGDLEAAIAEGSTWLRIGTAIFGPRD